MSQTPFAHAESLQIGTIDFIAPDEVKVLLDIEAPESVALNAGGPRPFPRVNGYVLMPVDDGFLVGQIEWLTIERSAFPKRRGVQDFGLIDLPYPLRKMSLNSLGTLRKQPGVGESYQFRRGADALPSVGAPVLLPTEKQLRSIVESGERQRVQIGTSPLAANATVSIDPDRLFGRHLALLGNTGSGKSCSVAGLIRWSLEAAEAKFQNSGKLNARFIVLDPNGEYSRAFAEGDDDVEARIFKVDPEEGESPLKVPLWFWNSAEWASFTQASARTQRPLLKRALREVKAGQFNVVEPADEYIKLALRRYLSTTLITIQNRLKSGAIRNDPNNFGRILKTIHADLENKVAAPELRIDEIKSSIKVALDYRYNSFIKEGGDRVEFYKPFEESLIDPIINSLKSSLESLGGIVYQEGPDEDVPLHFQGTDLADHLQILAEQ